jgi:hypothetical protein
MKKRVLASALAAICMLSTGAMNAIAADSEVTASSQTITVTTSVKSPSIKVTMPTATTVTINPYKIKVETKAASGSDPAEYSQAGVVGAPMSITNGGDTPIAIEAKAKVEVGEDTGVKLATAALTGKETAATLLLYVEGTTEDFSDSYDAKSENQLLLSATEATKSILSLDAKGGTTTTGKIQIGGDATSVGDWTKVDQSDTTGKKSIVVSLVFNINAQANEVE